jgi:hypothetical protein
MYTSIVHPEDGRELQIKCGEDICETYRVGDIVNAYPSPNRPGCGYLLDDVYESYSDRGVDDWVVISGGKVVAVERRRGDPQEDPLGHYEVLRLRYNVQPPPRDWWPESVWAEQSRREESSRIEFNLFLESIKDLRADQRLAHAMTFPIKRQLEFSSIGREALVVSAASEPQSQPICDAGDSFSPRRCTLPGGHEGHHHDELWDEVSMERRLENRSSGELID